MANIPSAKDYIHLLQKLYKFRHSIPDAKIHFSEAMLTLAEESLVNKGMGYCWFPKAGHFFVMSKPDLVKAFYKQPGTPFSQVSFFKRLAVVLGPNNLMSSELNSATHNQLRPAILNRNTQFLKHLPDIVHHFFNNYTRPKPLTEVMEALSRAVLIAAYFDKNIVARFEKHYARSRNLTDDLLSLIELDLFSQKKHSDLVAIRERLFLFGYDLLRSPKHGNNSFSWINLLLKVRVQQHATVCKTMHILLGKTYTKGEWPILSNQDWMRLLDYAREQTDKTLLSIYIREAINESIFIPLLGFDATATMLCTTIRIIIENPRIKARVKEEIHLLKTAQPKLTRHISYLDAVMREALRLFPPTPLIPEIVSERFSLSYQGKTLTFPKHAMVLIPLELLHRYPSIELTPDEQIQFGETQIASNTVFPERYNPHKPDGEPYHSRLYPQLSGFSFFSFKGENDETERKCPGSRLALSEGKEVLYQLLDKRDFKLFNHQPVCFSNSYEKPIQKSEGGGTLLLENLAPNLELT